MIWHWRIPDYYPNKRIGNYETIKLDKFIFQECKYINGLTEKPIVKFNCKKEFLYDVLPNDKMLIIVSDKVKKLLMDHCEDNIQFIDVDIIVENEVLNNYFIVNILNQIDILDIKKSVFKNLLNTNAILSFRKIIYTKEDIMPFHIARNKDYHPHVLVSNELKEIFDKYKIKGVSFKTADEIC